MKKLILIIEDNELNRNLLTVLLQDEYDLLLAENGQIGLDLLSEHYRDLSLILLDVYMPVVNGFEFLETVGKDSILSTVPVIVTTGSDNTEDEIKCLNLGALDFVTKPYNPEVVLGRIRSVLKLRESLTALSEVEYDALTGVYTMPAFSHYASQALRNSDIDYDLSVSDLKDFKFVNSILGEKTGNDILIRIARNLCNLMPDAVIGRQGDKFYSLYPSSLRAGKKIEDIVQIHLKDVSPIASVNIKYAFYKNVDRKVPISILCDRAIMALETVKEDSSRAYAEYNDELKNRMVQERDMELRFEEALQNGEFVVWFQPKVDTRTQRIVAAEALVRWITSDGTMLSPGAFIPVFEKNGMISQLDNYVFCKVCDFQKQRILQGKIVIPISVNLSRNSLYHPDTVHSYAQTITDKAISKSLIPIELTETVAMEGSKIWDLTALFTELGFSLHMDDFGTGYSSFSGLASMPFDVLKLDKSLINHIGSSKGNTLIRHIISIAQEIGMTVVAEGVETKPQFNFLKEAGCNQIQGFYFSPPKPQDVFEELLDQTADPIPFYLSNEYDHLRICQESELRLDEGYLTIMKQVVSDMQEGFFIYRANCNEAILYANDVVLNIFGCKDMEEFRKHVGNSFRGIVHPDEYQSIEDSIFSQINTNENRKDQVEYHIVRKDGSVAYVRDRGHYIHTEEFGNVFYVFISEIPEG